MVKKVLLVVACASLLLLGPAAGQQQGGSVRSDGSPTQGSVATAGDEARYSLGATAGMVYTIDVALHTLADSVLTVCECARCHWWEKVTYSAPREPPPLHRLQTLIQGMHRRRRLDRHVHRRER